ncbi:MAG: hypothetical protein MJ093_08890 [Saccharofermentans sp.]|nr:hypothetical protein [Saccharofermentans sp.]
MKSKVLISIFSLLLVASVAFNIYIYAPYTFGKMHRGDMVRIYTDVDYAHGRHMVYGQMYSLDYADGNKQCSYLSNNDIWSIQRGDKEYQEGYHVHSNLDVSYYEDLRALINSSSLEEIDGASWEMGTFDFPTAEYSAPFVIVIGNRIYTTDNEEILELVQQYDERVSQTVYNMGKGEEDRYK